jgi:hypothetical protein
MYILQAVLVFLKLTSGHFLFCTTTSASSWAKGDSVYFYHNFGGVSWWLILVPTYFIIADFILKQVLAQTKD